MSFLQTANLQHGESLLPRDTAGLASSRPTGERSVDSLLLELENTVNYAPYPRPPHSLQATTAPAATFYRSVSSRSRSLLRANQMKTQ